ncbi:unnamed protein product [Arabis nemorensis]|uniref:Uncharacterized protein n=1 Tax=Arabis nemorensis TaxID=586526 RepID=A0A565AYN7_9BRAS|nr:unnamed protein product [Arabis nemorensis]
MRRGRSRSVIGAEKSSNPTGLSQGSTLQAVVIDKSLLGNTENFAKGETSHQALVQVSDSDKLRLSAVRSNTTSEAEMDSSDLSSSEEEEEGEIVEMARRSTSMPVMRQSDGPWARQ